MQQAYTNTNIFDFPLSLSTPFLVNGIKFIQIGNAAQCCVLLMPYTTQEDKNIVIDFIAIWNEKVAKKVKNFGNGYRVLDK